MKKAAVLGWVVALWLLCGSLAHAELTVDIIGTQPADGVIAEDESAIVYWRIESDGSGDYQVEIGGDGTAGSGELITAEDGSGTFTGTLNSSSTISANDDLTEGDGAYTVYVIATMGEETANASTSIRLQIPPEQVTGLAVGRGDGKLYLTWDALEGIEDLDYYYVYYGPRSGSTPSDYDGVDAAEGPSPVATNDVSNFQLSGLTNGATYYVRVSAVDTLGAEGDLSEEASGTPTTTQGYAEMQNDSGGCFVATAAWGDYDHPLVRDLRAFRDTVLQRTPAGRRLILAYYAVSPTAASWLARHPSARAATRVVLTPVARLAGAEARAPGVVSLPLLVGLSLTWALVHRRRREEAR
jgi:hypothetical protein